MVRKIVFSLFLVASITAINATSLYADSPTFDVYHANQGLQYYEKGDYQQALDQLNIAIILNSSNSDYFILRGNIHGKLNNINKAIEDYQQAIRLSPNNPMALFLWARYTLILNPDYSFQYIPDIMQSLYKARSLFKQENNIQLYEETSNNIAQILLNYGISLSNKGQYEQALTFYNEAININPQSIDTYFFRGLRYFNLKQYLQASEDFSKVIMMNPNYEKLDYPVYFFRGVSFFVLQKYQKSQADLIKAKEIFKKKGNLDAYKDTQDFLDLISNKVSGNETSKTVNPSVHQNLPPVVTIKTRNQIINRSCKLARQGYTDGENVNEVYRLVRMNATEDYQMESFVTGGTSYGSQLGAILGNMENGLRREAMEKEAIKIFNAAKKKCKF